MGRVRVGGGILSRLGVGLSLANQARACPQESPHMSARGLQAGAAGRALGPAEERARQAASRCRQGTPAGLARN